MYRLISILFQMWSTIFYKGIKKVKFGKGTVFYGNVHIKNGKMLVIGNNSSIGLGSWIAIFTEYGGYTCPSKERGDKCIISIGNNVRITQKLKIYSCDQVKIEDNVLIASDVFITDYNHGIDVMSEYSDQPLQSNPVYIEKGCWIGERVCILPGVTIGEKSIVAAGSIVTKNIPPYSMAAGNPAKVIKKWDSSENVWKRT